MRFKGRDLNIMLVTFALVVVLVVIFLPVSSQISSAASYKSKGAVYDTPYSNDPIILGPVGTDVADNSSYYQTLLKSPEQTLTMAFSNLIGAKNYTATSIGKANASAGVVQDIKNVKIVDKDGNRYGESISYKRSGIAGVDTAMQEYAKGDVVKYRKTSSVGSNLVPSYKSGFSTMAASSFNNIMGRDVCGFNYKIGSNTIDGYGDMVDNGDGTHSFWVYLNDNAAAGYRKQCKEASGYDVYDFKYLRMYVTVYDSNLLFKSIKYEEAYSIIAIGKEFVTTNNIMETFDWGTANIPNPENLPQ